MAILTSDAPPASRKQVDFLRRENAILDAAVKLFEGPHWEQVTVEQIAREANIGKGTVYKHFKRKEEIHARIALAFNRTLMDQFNAVEQRSDVIATLQELIRVAFRQFMARPAEARVNLYCKREDFRGRLSEDYRQAFASVESEFKTFVTQTLTRGMNAGLIPKRPIEHMMLGLEATFEGTLSMMWNQSVRTIHDDLADNHEVIITVVSEYMLAGIVGLQHPQ